MRKVMRPVPRAERNETASLHFIMSRSTNERQRERRWQIHETLSSLRAETAAILEGIGKRRRNPFPTDQEARRLSELSVQIIRARDDLRLTGKAKR